MYILGTVESYGRSMSDNPVVKSGQLTKSEVDAAYVHHGLTAENLDNIN